jgi:hypothetical protein
MGGRAGEIRMDALMTENEKIARAGGDAAWLWTCSIFWSFRNHTNGTIPAKYLPQLSDRKQPRRLWILVQEKLWHEPGTSATAARRCSPVTT